MSQTLQYTPCLDVRYFLNLNLTRIVYRSLTQFEMDASIAWSVLFLFILIPNVLLLAIICFKRSLWTYSSVLVGSLCCANMIFDFFYVLPIKILVIRNSIHPFINIYCQLSSIVIQFAFVSCMNFHICSISLEKFIAITSPFWYNQISVYKSALFIIILLVCWILPIFVAFIPIIIGWWRICPYFCLISEIIENRKLSLQAWHIFWSFLMFLLPTFVTMVLYFRIYLVAKDHATRIQAASRNSSGHSSYINLKATKAVAIIIGLYLILQTPYNVYQVLTVVDKSIVKAAGRYNLREWLFYLASWHSVASPIIYGFFNKNLRDSVVAIVCRCKAMRFGTLTNSSVLT